MKGTWHRENHWVIFTPKDGSPELCFAWSNELRTGQRPGESVYSLTPEEYSGLLQSLDKTKDGEIYPDEKVNGLYESQINP